MDLHLTVQRSLAPEPGCSLEHAVMTSCDREPIHRPDAIQPYGLLLIADSTSLAVIGGAGDIEGRLAPDWLGRPLADVLKIPESRLHDEKRPSLSDLRVAGLKDETFSILRHAQDTHLLIELEPVEAHNLLTWDIFGEIDSTADRFERCPDTASVCRHGAAIFRRLTGFDRVLVYRFMEDGTGRVVGESRNDAFPSLMNHHFPASDIPAQARALYLRNRIRVIPDITYEAAPIRPPEAGLAGLDLSDVQLRSVSPIHLQYMANMGARASASVSLVVDGVLWGLIACHNATPRCLSEDIRAACRTLAGVMSRQLRNKEELVTYQERLRLRNAMEFVTSHFDVRHPIESNLRSFMGELQALFPCNGFAVISDETITGTGVLPDADNLHRLHDWLRLGTNGGIFVSTMLGKDYPPAAEWPERSAGLLAITLPFRTPTCLIWSRVEIIQTIEWAGNPHKDTAEGSDVLRPRASFRTWEQTIRGHSTRWTSEQKQAARRLRRVLIADYQTQQLRELNATLAATLEERENLLRQKDFLIREVNHRVQNSLQMVASFLKLQARSASNEETTTALTEAQHRIAAIGLVHRRLYRDEHFGIVDLGRYLEELMEELCSSLGADWHEQLHLSLFPIMISADRAINIGLVLTELVINASKYAYDGKAGPLHVGLTQTSDRLVLTVSDQGECTPQLKGTGFGTRMMNAVVSSLSGTLTYTTLSPGLEAVMTLPLDSILPSEADASTEAALSQTPYPYP
ncbi:GAF domain-containing protein [Gluconobacter sp. R71646]|uniref:histidine kinase n=1 Tax=Gluconobacter potus TaxID=2724927 RepID=A0ABR9YK41_9PROT|nr:GAF domain-containing protein [Gluconobacter sp. R71656]MBF0867724.1 GAF domain-containing protein [Gluconobacter sp. R75628]MBF0872934.1 GAF domain-containing protein [Gluconobacter sp. R75629]MBF0882180.1 GAF domain-containing protein [Gluconobacter potus]